MKQLCLDAYQKLNNSFNKTMIYHVGIDCGMFVEMNHMINAILYCLSHCIKFKLYSRDANFGTGIGWTEYFLPFCDEVQEPFHKKYNYHRLPSWRRILRLCLKQKTIGPLAWKLKSIVRNRIGHFKAYRAYKQRVLLSQDVPSRLMEHYVIPELGIDCGYNKAYELVAQMLWRFQPGLAQEKLQYKKRLNLPVVYDGIQVRGGDKATETELIDGSYIMQKLNPESGNTVFVLTDDYRRFNELQLKHPELSLKTLCGSDETGYHHKVFVNSLPEQKKKAVSRLLISVDILLSSHSFVGSITTGPSVFVMKQRLDEASVQAVDCPKEELALALSLTMDVRATISKKNVSAIQDCVHLHLPEEDVPQ